jgi:Na+/proline symporter
VLLTALGFYMWPHTFGSLYTAKEERAFRRNAAILPLYQLILLFVFFAGFAAILQVPGLKGADIDLSLLRLSVQTFDPWFVGVIGAAGVLTAIVPGSMILIASTTVLANNIFRYFRPEAPDAIIARLAKALVPVLAFVSVLFTLRGGTTIVALLLMGYSFVTQLFPALVASLLPHNPVTKAGAFASICVGVATVAATSLTHHHIPAVPVLARGSARSEHWYRRVDVEPGDVGDCQCRHPPAPHRSLFFLKTSRSSLRLADTYGARAQGRWCRAGLAGPHATKGKRRLVEQPQHRPLQ